MQLIPKECIISYFLSSTLIKLVTNFDEKFPLESFWGLPISHRNVEIIWLWEV